jgi:RimJ/RimL family protein N-acetyltransferase
MAIDIPTLHTERLDLLPPTADCADLYRTFYTDADASQLYGGPLSVVGSWTRLASDLGSWHLQGFGVWVLRDRERGELVGVCGFWQAPGWRRELTWWLLPRYRSRGFAQEASEAVVEHAYAVFGWPSVETYMVDTNDQAHALVRRLGGEQIERFVAPDGAERDLFRIPRPGKPAA